MTLTEILTAIARGDADENIDAIYEAYKERHGILKAQRASINRLTLRPGTKVRLVNIRPKHLDGKVGEVVPTPPHRRGSRTRIAVRFEPALVGFPNPMMVPATCVEPV